MSILFLSIYLIIIRLLHTQKYNVSGGMVFISTDMKLNRHSE